MGVDIHRMFQGQSLKHLKKNCAKWRFCKHFVSLSWLVKEVLIRDRDRDRGVTMHTWQIFDYQFTTCHCQFHVAVHLWQGWVHSKHIYCWSRYLATHNVATHCKGFGQKQYCNPMHPKSFFSFFFFSDVEKTWTITVNLIRWLNITKQLYCFMTMWILLETK